MIPFGFVTRTSSQMKDWGFSICSSTFEEKHTSAVASANGS